MSEKEELAQAEPKIHPFQRLLDNPWLLLALGLAVTFISYTAWGWIELATMTDAKLH